MRTYRERFIKNHRKERQIANNSKGYKDVYVYIGDFYTWEPPGRSFSSVRKLFALSETLTVIIFILASIPGTLIR